VADPRILATAPMVIDVLNFRPQMQHQLDTWGKYSEQIHDYTEKGLIKPGEETPREVELRRMMDPYTYRKGLTLPKLLINGTNDPYWVVDAMQWYWNDLIDPKYVLQVPNAGHGLDGGHERVFATLAAFFGHVAEGRPLPKLAWNYSHDDRRLLLALDSSAKPKAARLWRAYSPSKDFRKAKWDSRPMAEADGGFLGELPLPEEGHVAIFGELEFRFHELPYCLTTLVYRQ
jgi:PhoPQ-activated pathogenicity-related protein